ncbi:transposase [Escherichia coli]|uniref:transposase n=1 Tax=Escherichia coli TaxID=562 RepID=UPI000A99518C
MDEKQLQALANELAKNLKTPEDLSQFDRLLKKISVEAALNAEMSHHLGYDKNQPKPGANSRNGYSTKTVITGDGHLELRTPRDRDGSFEPQLVKKNQTRITGMDNQILSLYAKGLTTREIAAAFKELYDADVVSKRTARAVLTGMCYSAGSAMRHGSSSLTRLTGQSAMTPSTWRR